MNEAWHFFANSKLLRGIAARLCIQTMGPSLSGVRSAVLTVIGLAGSAVACHALQVSGVREFDRSIELRIDGSRELLVQSRWLVVSPSGTIAMEQGQNSWVLLYEAGGRRIAQYGRAGDGPGEFRALTSGGWIGDSLWVYDRVNNRVTVLTPLGAFGREFSVSPLRADAAAGVAYPVGVNPPVLALGIDGSYVTRVAINERTATTAFPDGSSHWFSVALNGVIQTWLGRSLSGSYYVRTQVGNGLVASALPHVRDPVDTLSADGSRRLASTLDYSTNHIQLNVLTVNGDTLRKVRYPYQPVPLSRQTVDSSYQALQRTHGTRSPAHLANLLSKRVDPPVNPPLHDAFLGNDGSIWARVLPAPPQQQVWVAFDSVGVPRGRLTLPTSVALRAATAERAWVVEYDQFDVPSIVVYRLTASGG